MATPIYNKLYPEVVSVYGYMDKATLTELTDSDLQAITQRICEERPGDAIDFYVYLSEVEELGDNDDWSEVNNGIENMIKKYSEEKQGGE
ncbi:hypothetical protein Goe25_02540 [Bacillus phage vB_BsuM-Goe25]|nr:hypothetical protein BSP14_005 [Bacillus phage BSP14]WCS69643.1 hypothetical protein Goe25_00100 [Bacillus phage vB_BsuM-Goe25]WCS69882.1 hypothetical protein Goe25_02540 [Bacillus phage vB_BsuM-Goe25]